MSFPGNPGDMVPMPQNSGGDQPLMSPEQQRQAQMVIQKLAGIAKQVMSGQTLGGGSPAANHKPILKALEELGIPLRTRDIQLGCDPSNDEKTTVCVVIPLQELISKEYEFLTGVNVEAVGETGATSANGTDANNQIGEWND